MAKQTPVARIVTGGTPAPARPAPEPEQTPQFTVAITLTERQSVPNSGYPVENTIQANFLIEAEDAPAAANEANRLAADFAAAVPFVPKEYRVNVSPFPQHR